jgi:hypothetical protein
MCRPPVRPHLLALSEEATEMRERIVSAVAPERRVRVVSSQIGSRCIYGTERHAADTAGWQPSDRVVS